MNFCSSCPEPEVCNSIRRCFNGHFFPTEVKEPEGGFDTNRGNLKSLNDRISERGMVVEPSGKLKEKNIVTVSLKKAFNTASLKSVIEFAFLGDPEMYKYHVLVNPTFEEMVDNTYSRINEFFSKYEAACHLVIANETLIGYVVTATTPKKNILYSFALNNEFRSKEIVTLFIEQVKLLLNNEIIAMLYEKNKRAIGFLLKNGFKMLSKSEDVIVLTCKK